MVSSAGQQKSNARGATRTSLLVGESPCDLPARRLQGVQLTSGRQEKAVWLFSVASSCKPRSCDCPPASWAKSTGTVPVLGLSCPLIPHPPLRSPLLPFPHDLHSVQSLATFRTATFSPVRTRAERAAEELRHRLVVVARVAGKNRRQPVALVSRPPAPAPFANLPRFRSGSNLVLLFVTARLCVCFQQERLLGGQASYSTYSIGIRD